MQYYFVYSTFPDRQTAKSIAKTLLEERRIACANIFPEVSSMFHWEGIIETTQETVCIFKTQITCYTDLEQRIKELHPYETPCIVAFSAAAGNPDFLRWITTAVSPKESQ